MSSDLSSMSLVELATEMDKLTESQNQVKAEVLKRFGIEVPESTVVVKPKVQGEKRGRKKQEGGTTTKFPSLKEIVQTILAKHPEGLELKGIALEVEAMRQRGEYASNAKSIPAVVAQAVTALKQESLLNHDKESKKYSIMPKVA
jgi:hypothetical protein